MAWRVCSTLSVFALLFTVVAVGVAADEESPVPEALASQKVSHVVCETSKGSVRFELRPDWAPFGVFRFLELVDAGFFTNNLFYRVPPPASNPIVQWGVCPNAAVQYKYDFHAVPDDRQRADLLPFRAGYLAFAGGGVRSRSAHMFVALSDAPHIGKQQWEVPIGRVTEGLDVLRSIEQVGDVEPWGSAPPLYQVKGDPTFWNGEFPGDYLREHYPRIDYWKSCARVEPPDWMFTGADAPADDATEAAAKGRHDEL